MSNHDYSRWLAPVLVTLAAIVLQALGAEGGLRFERELITTGPWRLLTGNLVHLGWTHLAINIVGLTVIHALVARELTPGEWTTTIFTCSLATTTGLLLLSPAIGWYVGLSGALHGLLVAASLAAVCRAPVTVALLMTAVAAKIGWELYAGSDPATGQIIGGTVIVTAHLYGALGGLPCGIFLAIRRRQG